MEVNSFFFGLTAGVLLVACPYILRRYRLYTSPRAKRAEARRLTNKATILQAQASWDDASGARRHELKQRFSGWKPGGVSN